MRGKIAIKNLHKNYASAKSSIVALRDVTFEINNGERIAILGPNGCGKTTLLNILSGFIAPNSGSIIVNNKNASSIQKSTMIFQDLALFDWKTVEGNILFALRGKGSKTKNALTTEKYTKLLGLSDFTNKYPYELSGGMKQKVAIARALAAEPEVLLMDEPFAALDIQTKELIQEELNNVLSKTNKTAVLITHDIDEALFMADKVVVMTARPGTIKEVLDVKLPFPRDPNIRKDPRFQELKNRIWNSLREENEKTMEERK